MNNLNTKIGFFLNYILCYFLYIISLVLYFIEKNEIGSSVLFFSLIMRILLFLYWIIIRKRICSKGFHLQYIKVQLVIATFFAGRFIFGTYSKYEIVFGILEMTSIILSIVYSLVCLERPLTILREIVSKEKFLIYFFPFLIFLLLSIQCIKVSFVWDSELYVRKIVQFNSQFLFSFSNIKDLVTSHLQLGVDFIYSIFYSLFLQNGNYVLFGNIILGGIAIFHFGKIVNHFYPAIENIELGLIILLLVFSPFFLGMIGGISLDYAMMCFYICYVDSVFRNKRVDQIFWGGLLCFSKEPGVLLGAGLIGMLLFFDIIVPFVKLKIFFRM